MAANTVTPSASAVPASGYTLTYWDLRSLGEVPRLLMAAAGIEWTDERLPWARTGEPGSYVYEKPGWDERKPKMPYGHIPVLSWVDGSGRPIQLAESSAICRFLARRHGLIGVEGDEVEAALLDAAFEAVLDIHRQLGAAKGQPAALETFWSKGLVSALTFFERNVQGAHWIARSDRLSYADIAAYYLLFVLRNKNDAAVTRALEPLPKLRALERGVAEQPQVAAYLARRKVTLY